MTHQRTRTVAAPRSLSLSDRSAVSDTLGHMIDLTDCPTQYADGTIIQRAIHRAAYGSATFNETVDVPITTPTVVKTTAGRWDATPGQTLHLTPTRSEILEPGLFRKAAEVEEQRYTLSAWYIPDRLDAHDEWTDPDTLQKAAWSYVQNADRTVYLQHDRATPAGEWVEIMSWPQPITLEKQVGKPYTYPAGTVFLGVKWDDWAWQLVKAGQIRGLSIGGRAVRTQTDMVT